MPIIADLNQKTCGQGTSTGTGGKTSGENNILVPKKYVYINWNSNESPETQIRKKLNNLLSWDVSGNDLYLIYNYKNQTMVQQENFNPEIHTWIFRRGKGKYGTTGTDAIENNGLLYPLAPTRGNYENVEYDLGVLTSVDINEYINNQSITFSINNQAWNIFTCIQDGVGKKYLYMGDLQFIGNSSQPEVYPVQLEDFWDISSEPVYQPTVEEPSFYDKYSIIDPATLTLADFSAGAEFYFIEEINTELMHFAVKQTQKDAAAFDGARVHIDGNNYDLENPTSQNGYDIYLLGSADDIGNPNGNNLPFNVWSFGGISEDLGTAAFQDSDDFATAAQGAKADTALQFEQLQSDGSIYLDAVTKTIGLNIAEITERFTFNGTNRTFTLSNESTYVQAVIVNRSANLILLDDYIVQTVDQVEINSNYNLESGDIIRITYTYLAS